MPHKITTPDHAYIHCLEEVCLWCRLPLRPQPDEKPDAFAERVLNALEEWSATFKGYIEEIENIFTDRAWLQDPDEIEANGVNHNTAEAVRTSTAEAVRTSTAEAVRTSTAEAVRTSTAEAVRTSTAEAVSTSKSITTGTSYLEGLVSASAYRGPKNGNGS